MTPYITGCYKAGYSFLWRIPRVMDDSSGRRSHDAAASELPKASCLFLPERLAAVQEGSESGEPLSAKLSVAAGYFT